MSRACAGFLQRVTEIPIVLLLTLVLFGCHNSSTPRGSPIPPNHAPVIDSLLAYPDTIGPSDSTVVVCAAHDIDGDSLVYDWQTDARLNIQGTPTWNKHLNNTHSPSRMFYNADLPNPINDSAWVYCLVRDPWGGGDARRVFIILRSP
jgi:hypothetical protein